MAKKLFTLILCIVIIYLGVTHKAWFLAMMKSGGSVAVAVSILLIAILVFFPIIPAIVAEGMVGATYGTWEGTLISLTGAMLGTIVMFGLARFGFSTWARDAVQKYPKIKEYEEYFEKHGFLAVLIARLIPVIPTPVVNVVAGLTRISWIVFFVASLLGKLPANLLYNFAGSQMQTNKWLSIVVDVGYIVVVGVIASIYNWRKNKTVKSAS